MKAFLDWCISGLVALARVCVPESDHDLREPPEDRAAIDSVGVLPMDDCH